MGSFLSSRVGNSKSGEHANMLPVNSSKKLRLSSSLCNDVRLIPYLPDEISLQILSRLPRIHYLKVKSVSKRWKSAITSHELFQLRKELGVTEEWLYLLIKVDEDKLLWYAFDPLSGEWQRLPAMPYVVGEEEPMRRGLPGFYMGNVARAADFIRAWIWQRENLDHLPFCGCSVGAVNGSLYVLGGFSRSSVMNCVWRYDPCVNAWQEVNSMNTARAFGKTGLLNNKLYVVGGVNRGRDGFIPIRSAEVFDPNTGLWKEISNMPFLKAEVLPAVFLANLLKPIATGMASYRGRLYVPQSLYSWPFFFDIGGEMYDPETNSWMEMPVGMGEAWPAKQAGTKLSVVVDEDLYALDPSNSMNYSKIKKYDSQEDSWKDIIDRVPLQDVSCTESPYLLASLLGKLQVITKNADNHITVLEADLKRCIEADPNDAACKTSTSSRNGETEHWKVLVAKDFGSAELVSCQVLEA